MIMRTDIKKFAKFTTIVVFVLSLPVSVSAAIKTSASVPGPTKGLVGYWTLDGKDTNWSANTTSDKSGQGNTGTLISMSTTTSPRQGIIGQALKFNASGRVNVPNYNINSNQITVSFWFNTDDANTVRRIIEHDWNVGGVFTTHINSGTVNACFNGTCSPMLTAPIVANKWYHLVLTYSGTTARMYLNGVQQAPANYGTAIANSTHDIFIGSSSFPFSGMIDDVRMYNRALSAREVISLYNQGAAGIKSGASQTSANVPINSGLVGYWPMDGRDVNWTANTTADKSGQGNTGTLINMSTTTSPSQGVIGQALNFNGSNYAVTANNDALNFGTGPFSFSVWVNANSLTANADGVFSKDSYAGGNSYTGYLVNVRAGPTWSFETRNVVSGAGPDNVVLSASNATTGWTHIVAVRSGNSPAVLRLYINGVLSNTTTEGSVTDVSNSAGFTIGNLNSGLPSQYFNGKTDDVRAYNRALSASEIKQLYQQGAAGLKSASSQTGANVPINNGLVGYWPFDGKDTNWTTGMTADKSGQGNMGTLVNMSTTTSPAQGKIGQAFRFGGATSYINVGNPASLSFSNQSFSVSSWVRLNTVPTADGNDIGIVADYRNTNARWFLYKFRNAAGTFAFALDTNGAWSPDKTAFGSTVPVTNRWYHVVGVYDHSTGNALIYVNGVFENNSGGSPITIGAVNDVTIGNWYSLDGLGGTSGPNGDIDDVRIYNRALSVTEVKKLYNLGR